MSRYYGYVLITFADGTTDRVGGNRDAAKNDVLTVWTESDGFISDRRNFPLANIKEWRWEKDS